MLDDQQAENEDEEGKGLQDTDGSKALSVESRLLKGCLDAGGRNLSLEDGRDHDRRAGKKANENGRDRRDRPA